MYVTKNLYEKFAQYVDMESMKFFIQMSKRAFDVYKTGKKFKKNETPVVYGSSVKDFNDEYDKVIARVEMNQRGVLRDFIGIDWDFDEGDEDKLEKLLTNLKQFHEKYQTPIIIYPTFSYPKKPRVRTVMFTEEEMDKMSYAQAVTFVVKALDVDPKDESNYNIAHNFNLPIINTPEQKEMMTFHKTYVDKLPNALWSKVKSNVPVRKSVAVKRTPVSRIESQSRDRQSIEKGLQNLSNNMKAQNNNRLDFNTWTNFFQFLHSVARAEAIGSISRADALYILEEVAGGNIDYQRRNKEDYLREFPRVRDNEDKLEAARGIAYYFGHEW